MPELPEIETTRLGVAPHLEGKRIQTAVIRNGRLRWPVPRKLPQLLAGRRIERVQRRSKYLLLDCGGGWLILHLGMSGSLRVVPASTPPGMHDHVDLVLENGYGAALARSAPFRRGAVGTRRSECAQAAAQSRARAVRRRFHRGAAVSAHARSQRGNQECGDG